MTAARRCVIVGVLIPFLLAAIPQLWFRFIPGCHATEVAAGCKLLGVDLSGLFTVLAYGTILFVPAAFVSTVVALLIWNANSK